MNEMLGFLRQIESCPGDSSLREIFGDWLEEHGYDRWEAYGSPLPLKPLDAFMIIVDESGFGGGGGSGSGSRGAC